MTDVLALERLYNLVSVSLTSSDFGPVAHPFGWREPTKRAHRNGARIIWVPGDDENGDVGEFKAPKYPGRLPRPIATVDELFTVYVEADDPTAPESEIAQYKATRLLSDAWWSAAYAVAHGTIKIVRASWVIDKRERRHGATMRLLCTVEAMVSDARSSGVEVTRAKGVAVVRELSATEAVEGLPPLFAVAAASTSVSLSGLADVDGVALTNNARVLVTAQASDAANGLYAAKSGAWVRADELDSVDDFIARRFVRVTGGSRAGGYQLTSDPPTEIGVSPIVFERIEEMNA